MRFRGIPRLELFQGAQEGSPGISGGPEGAQGASGGGPFHQHMQAEMLGAFADHFPDQSGWLVRLADPLGCKTVGSLMRRLAYDQPPELLTMHLCLFLSTACASAAEPEFDSTAAWRAISSHQARTGSAPHPRKLCALMMATNSGSGSGAGPAAAE